MSDVNTLVFEFSRLIKVRETGDKMRARRVRTVVWKLFVARLLKVVVIGNCNRFTF